MKRHMLLVPLDGSPLAEAALPYAAALASTHGDGIELLSVVEDLGRSAQAGQLARLAAAGLRTRLHVLADRLRAQGLSVETALVTGSPAEQILVHAEKARFRAVVLTTRGLGGVERPLVGSTADKVIRLAHPPVLAVRPDDELDQPVVWQPERVLVPLDGSPEAEQALAVALPLAAVFGSEVVLARVQPWLGAQLTVYGRYMPDVGRLDEEAGRAAAGYLRAVRCALPEGVPTRAVVLHGNPADRLANLIEAEGIGLVVMTAHGWCGLRRAVLGSVADRLLRLGVPALVCRPAPISPLGQNERASVLAAI